jgi:integrase
VVRISGSTSYLSAAFGAAIRTERFRLANPVTGVRKRKEPRGVPQYLKAEEVLPMLGAVTPRWRDLFATALYTGLRKGELFALRKSDADLKGRLLTVARSHARDTTKGGHADVIPIAQELVPYLEHAITTSPSSLVFPDPKGKMLPEKTQLQHVLRRALTRANIVTGYRHSCRRKGCGYVERTADGELRRCPSAPSRCGRSVSQGSSGSTIFATRPHRS